MRSVKLIAHLLFILALTASSVVSADVLCAKNRVRASVKSKRITLNLPRQFTTATATCPTGFTKIATTGEPLTGTLTSGETMIGFWNLGSDGSLITSPGTISFPKPLATAPNVEVVRMGTTGTNCPGTALAPTAAAGYLCIYEGYSVNLASGSAGLTTFNIDGSNGTNQASVTGAALYGNRATTTEYFAWGSWAVKAP